MSEFSSTSSTAADWTFVYDAFAGDDPDDEEPPTLGVREPRRPMLPTLDGAVALEVPTE